MNVSFRGRRLERAYRESAEAVRRWGPKAGRRYIVRVTQLASARDWDDILKLRALRAHALKGDRKGLWAIDMDERWRLIVRPNQEGIEIEVVEVSRHYGD